METESLPPPTPHFHPGVCSACLQPPENTPSSPPLLRCSQCKIARYCSKLCQRKHWKKHKSLCSKMYRIYEGEYMYKNAKTSHENGKTWEEIKLFERLTGDMKNLNASLSNKEDSPNMKPYIEEMFNFPRICKICFECNQDILAACPHCNSVFYCSSKHKDEDAEVHLKYCMNYRLLILCDRFELENGGEMMDLPFPSPIDKKYLRLPGKLILLLKKHFEIEEGKEMRNPNPGLLALISQRLSYPISLLYALQDVNLGPQSHSIDSIEELRIHVVGAKSPAELLGIIKWEYFAHRLPNLNKLHFTFVGDELLKCEQEYIEGEDHLVDHGFTLCDQCKQDRTIVYELVNKLYQNYVKEDYYQKPHAIVAYNCGFHEIGSKWSDAYGHMVADMPLVFTSYTEEEALKDLESIKCHAPVEVIMDTQPNPMRSIRPHRNPESTSDALFFWNNYITVVRRDKSD